MNHVLPAARPLHTALACVLLFGGALAVQVIVSRVPQPDPWAGLASSSERARTVMEAIRPCEQALEQANLIRRTSSEGLENAQAVCGRALSAVESAGLPESCRAAAGAASQAATVLARHADAGREIARYRSSRMKCLSEAAA